MLKYPRPGLTCQNVCYESLYYYQNSIIDAEHNHIYSSFPNVSHTLVSQHTSTYENTCLENIKTLVRIIPRHTAGCGLSCHRGSLLRRCRRRGNLWRPIGHIRSSPMRTDTVVALEEVPRCRGRGRVATSSQRCADVGDRALEQVVVVIGSSSGCRVGVHRWYDGRRSNLCR